MTNSTSTESSPLALGQPTVYKNQYDASLLYPIARMTTRTSLLGDSPLPFVGMDIWTAYEVSWLNTQGRPQLTLVEFIFSHDSANIVESKSLKLYLNSLNQTKFDSADEVKLVMLTDLSAVVKGNVDVIFYDLDDTNNLQVDLLPGHCIDECDIAIEHYHPEASLLSDKPLVGNNESSADNRQQTTDNGSGDVVENELLYSHLLKTNCPVTNQPDWASVFIQYSGPKIQEDKLLAYIISFREHQDFHENCVEQIFFDINEQCRPKYLAVYARYTRRGGLDINPLRYSVNYTVQPFKNLRLRTSRQ